MRQKKSFHDTRKKAFSEKVLFAIDYYREKFKEDPDEVQVNKSMLDGTEQGLKITVRTFPYIFHGTLIVGLNDSRFFGTKR